MLVSRRCLFELYLKENQVFTQENLPFNAAFYSRFKYGSGQAAAHYAQLLCQILANVWQPSQHWAVTSSAYKCVPTASDAIAQEALKIMQQLAHHQTIASVNAVKIHRNILFDSDYGNLPYEQRLQLMQQTPLEITMEQAQGKHLLIIDDLRVTGAHEQKVHDLLRRTEAEQLLFVYVAEWKQSVEPTIEHRLNHEWVKSLKELKYIIDNEEFIINARVCKFLLSYPSLPDLAAFYAQLSPALLLRLHAAICGDGYHVMPSYKDCYAVLKQCIDTEKS